MKEQKMILLTLRCGPFSEDFELPWEEPLQNIYPLLLSVLKKIDPRRFADWGEMLLEKDGAFLMDEQASLRDYGICTGSDLNIARR